MKTRAEVNQGRWIVECPADDCYSALLVSDKWTSMLCDCRDDMVCDHPRLPCDQRIVVVMPDDAAEITRILNLRPRRATRNWTWDESTQEIKLENMTNGVRI